MQYTIISHTIAIAHSVKIISQFAFNHKSYKLNETKFCITSVLRQNNISPIFSIENILLA